MADGSHRIATESKGRNVLIESQYAVQELRTIPVQQSGNGLTTVRADVFNGVLDAEGRAGVNIQLPVATGAPGMLNATLTTRVFEPGGDASIYSQTVPFSPFTSYVGINLNQPKGKYIETDKDHVFDIVTVNDQGQPVNRSNLEYKIYRISWSWWWENGEESFGTYINNSSITPVASGNLQTTGGKASFKFRINYPDWGRYLVYVKDRESGHAPEEPSTSTGPTGADVEQDRPERHQDACFLTGQRFL